MPRAEVVESAVGKRERILAAAGGLFSREDYASVLVDDIAAEAGVAKGTLYNYFGSKDALYRELVTARLEALIALLRDGLERGQTPSGVIRNLVEAAVSFMLNDPAFFLIWKREEGRAAEGARKPWCRLREQLHAVVAEALRSGREEIAGDPEVDAAYVFGAVDGMVFRNLSRTADDSRVVTEREMLIRFIARAVGVEPTS